MSQCVESAGRLLVFCDYLCKPQPPVARKQPKLGGKLATTIHDPRVWLSGSWAADYRRGVGTKHAEKVSCRCQRPAVAIRYQFQCYER